jgi:uncharacterized protein (DUF1810 family)
MNSNHSSLYRFLAAQNGIYNQVILELHSGHKVGHWMWFVFPQLKGLGKSEISQFYGLDGIEEARLYWVDEVLGSRLRDCLAILVELRESDPQKIFGFTDSKKLKSCLTLFKSLDDTEEGWIDRCLYKFYDGAMDEMTLKLLIQ